MKCQQCNLELIETSMQRNNRVMKNGPRICRDCNRINLAEGREKEREEVSNRSVYEIMYQKALSFKKIYGSVNAPLLMMKLKLSADDANNLVSKINNGQSYESLTNG